jgi:hypothetical protein
MSQQKQMFSLQLLEQRENVEQECIKLQGLVDEELEDSTFMWCPDSNYVHITQDIFRKSKRMREINPEDVIGKVCTNIRFEVKGSESPHSPLPANIVILEVDSSQRHPSFSFVPYNSVLSESRSSSVEVEVVSTPEAEVSESVSHVQGFVTPEHVTWSSESPKTPWSQQREQRIDVPLNLDVVELPANYHTTGKGLFCLFKI